jgi:MarR family transcriptional regulator, organic hydroperoxide resistance regulator
VDEKSNIEKQVFMASRDNGVNSVLFRNAVARKLGLNITESECLSFVTIKGAASPTEIARYTGLTTGSTTTMLDRLEKTGFIKRLPNPKDRRGVLVEINERYRETVGPFVAGIQEAQSKLISSYSNKELETIADFLTRFADNVKDSTEAVEKA